MQDPADKIILIQDLFRLSQQFLIAKNQIYRRYFIKTTDLSHRMNIIVGARGIGKTTTLVQALLDHLLDPAENKKTTLESSNSNRILYLQADHFLMKNLSLYEIAEYFVQHGGEFLAIDEIHKYPTWSMELKSIFDTFEHLKILVSGSSALEISKGSHDLSRRGLVFRMAGLSFREFLEVELGISLEPASLNKILSDHVPLAQNIISQLTQPTQPTTILSAFKKYLEEGYYPYRQSLSSKVHYQMALEQNIHVTLESDLVAIYPELTGRSISRIKKLLSLIANQVPFVPNWNKMVSILELGDTRTLKQYFQYLESAELVLSLSSHSKKLKGLENPEKIFLNNPNLLYTLASQNPEIGTLRETFFANMLMFQHDLTLPSSGDFQVDEEFFFEVGGAKKSFEQLENTGNSANHTQKKFVVSDNIEIGFGQRIPLWLFGFMY